MAASQPARAVFGATLVGTAAIYFYHLGDNSFSANEAFAVWGAAMPGPRAIVAIPVNYDPGKQLLYYITLHFWTALTGNSESWVRSTAAAFGLADVALLFALGRELFDEETAAAAALAWAFNPMAVSFSHRARTYTMFIALALAHFLLLWRTRKNSQSTAAIASGVLGAALVWAHLAGVLIIGAEAAMLLRDLFVGRRDARAWLAIAIALALSMPLAPIVIAQSHLLIQGQWLGWINPSSAGHGIAAKFAVAAMAVAMGLWLLFGRSIESRRDEPLRWLVAWAALPLIAFEAGSFVFRPLFSLRYAAPEIAAIVLLGADALALVSTKVRNLTAAAIATLFLILIPFALLPDQPWRQVARIVAASSSSTEPIFFEGGYISAARIPNDGFPFGYYSIPFDYYFKGANPRVVVPAYDAAAARATIQSKVAAAGGGWLISWKSRDGAAPELPDPREFKSTVELDEGAVTIFRIVPIAPASASATPPAPPRSVSTRFPRSRARAG